MLLLRLQKLPVVGRGFMLYAKWRGVQIPPRTYEIPPRIAHVGPIVVHEQTRFGRDVTVYHGVTVGRADMWREPGPDFRGFTIGDHAILCAGASLVSSTELIVAEGTVVGTNAVLTQSTGPWEIWAGAPARKIGMREAVPS